nr:deoxyribodipyrimidine photolyase [Salmonella sp. NCTC 7297]
MQLNGLQVALAGKGIPLLFYEVADFNASIETVKNVCRQHDVSHLFYNYQYEINERQRDAAVEKTLQSVICEGFDDSVIPGARRGDDRQS